MKGKEKKLKKKLMIKSTFTIFKGSLSIVEVLKEVTTTHTLKLEELKNGLNLTTQQLKISK